jgi:Coatomer WD associated region
VRAYDFNTGSDIGLLNIRKFGSPYVPPRTLSFNPAERAVIATITSDNSLYELASLPAQSQGEVKDSSVDGKKGAGHSAIFVARNRFAVLNKTSQVSVSSCLLNLKHSLLCTPDNSVAYRSPRPFQFRCQVHQTAGPNK